ncbi:MAG: hypothetical protein Q3971_03105 [Moraxella sp.]|nr:hypothetical protein [Moraxella sp.]
MGLPIPDEPPTDYAIGAIINTFWLANRGRSYLSGMTVLPLPLNVQNISDVLAVYPLFLPRDWVDKAVFAIDDEYLKAVRT